MPRRRAFGPNAQPQTNRRPLASHRSCRDVTSIDNNWDNDMLCTRGDGSRFYTSYEGAAEFLG